ncbi:MAG: hypothetical protein Fur0035_06740 [Anaerolineales bacterium]
MKNEHFHETDSPKEAQDEIPTAPALSKSGRARMSAPLPPSATNPETPEVSRANKEAVPGRDDGLSQTPAVSDPAVAGRQRIQAALSPASDDSTQLAALQPSTSPSLPSINSTPGEQAGQTVLPPVSPPLPVDAVSPIAPQTPASLPTDTAIFKTDYSSAALGGAADQINAENADINKANRELREAKAEASRIESETGLPIAEYRRQAAFRLAHPEMFDSSDPQEILNSSIPISPSLPGTSPKADAPIPEKAAPPSAAGDSSQTATDAPVKMPPKFENVEQVNVYYDQALANFGDSPTHRQFLEHLQQKGMTLSALAEEQIDGNFSNYLTRVHSLASEAGISDAQAGSIVHRMGELHTLKRYPQEIADGQRLLEQPILYENDEQKQKRKELDRVTVKGDTHHIQDIKPIHLDKFIATQEGQTWADEMSKKHGADFVAQIQQGTLNPFSEVSPGTRRALKNFSKADLAQYQQQLQEYEELYRQANPKAKKVRAYVQPYYKL